MVTVAGDTAGTLNTASVFVRLKPLEERRRDQAAVMAEVRNDVLPLVAKEGVRAAVQASGGPGGGGGDIQFVLQGPKLEDLERYSEALREKVAAIPGLVDVDTTLNLGKPELSVHIDRPKAADLGVSIGDAAEALRLLVGGDAVTTFNDGGEQYEVHLRAREEDRTTAGGDCRAVGALVAPRQRDARQHRDLRARRVAGHHQPHRAAAAGDASSPTCCPARRRRACSSRSPISRKTLGMTPEYRAGFTGRSRELNRTATAFLSAIVLSLVFMYLILAAQFESWLHPVTILLSLPLTLPFALISIVIFGQSLNIFSGLGLLVLFGVVKKNSILQIDHANQLRAAGLETRDGGRAGEPRSAAADSDDDARVRRRHGAAGGDARRRLGDQPRARLGRSSAGRRSSWCSRWS